MGIYCKEFSVCKEGKEIDQTPNNMKIYCKVFRVCKEENNCKQHEINENVLYEFWRL